MNGFVISAITGFGLSMVAVGVIRYLYSLFKKALLS